MRESYRRRRDMVVTGPGRDPRHQARRHPGDLLRLSRCVGLPWAPLRKSATVDELCDWLLETHGVTTVPGSAFGDHHCIRLSFAASERDIATGLERLKAGFAALA